MPNDSYPAPGWSFAASGKPVEPGIGERIKEGLTALLADTRFGKAALEFLTNADGWQVTANGAAGDSQDHHTLFARLRDLITSPDANTGSSSFTSPFVSQSNFHVTSSETGGTTADQAAGTGTASGGGVSAPGGTSDW